MPPEYPNSLWQDHTQDGPVCTALAPCNRRKNNSDGCCNPPCFPLLLFVLFFLCRCFLSSRLQIWTLAGRSRKMYYTIRRATCTGPHRAGVVTMSVCGQYIQVGVSVSMHKLPFIPRASFSASSSSCLFFGDVKKAQCACFI